MKVTSTLIIPFHFRAHIENRKGEIFSKDIEPTPVTLMRHWSKRYYPSIKPLEQLAPSDELIQSFKSIPAFADWERRFYEIAESTKTNATPYDRDFEVKNLDKEIRKLIEQNTSGDKNAKIAFNKYASHVINKEVLRWSPIWSQLEAIDEFNTPVSSDQGLSVECAQKITSFVRNTIHKSTIKITDRDGESCKITGLDAWQISKIGLSSSMKHMWSIDDELNELPKSDASHSDQGINLISGRSIVLSLRLDVLKSIFGTCSFKIANLKEETFSTLTISRILVVLMPDQNGYCCFTFDIDNDSSYSLEDMQETLYMLARLGDEYSIMPVRQHQDFISHPLYSQLRAQVLPKELLDDKFTIRDLTLWLIALDDLEAKNETINTNVRDINRCGHLRKYPHHTSIHLTADELPKGEDWHDVLRQEAWRASRAIGMRRTPAALDQQGAQALTQGELITYSDLISNCAREGSCVISWDLPPSDDKYKHINMSDWSKHYQGIYLLFHLHVLGEEAMLEDLSYASLEIIKQNISISSNLSRKSYQERLKIRDKLKKLIYEMVYLNLSFSSASTGGSSDYMQHLLTLKSIYSIDELRDELRNNISELSDIVEQIDQEQQQRFDNSLTVLGALVLPFGILSGLMGMNNFSLTPETLNALTPSYLNHISFTGIILTSLSVSGLLLFFARERIKPMLAAASEAKQNKSRGLKSPRVRVKHHSDQINH